MPELQPTCILFMAIPKGLRAFSKKSLGAEVSVFQRKAKRRIASSDQRRNSRVDFPPYPQHVELKRANYRPRGLAAANDETPDPGATTPTANCAKNSIAWVTASRPMS